MYKKPSSETNIYNSDIKTTTQCRRTSYNLKKSKPIKDDKIII